MFFLHASMLMLMLYRRVRGAGGGAAAGALAMPLHEAWQVLLEGFVSHLLAVSSWWRWRWRCSMLASRCAALRASVRPPVCLWPMPMPMPAVHAQHCTTLRFE